MSRLSTSTSILTGAALALNTACAAIGQEAREEQELEPGKETHISMKIAHAVVDTLGGVASPVTCDELTQRMDETLSGIPGMRSKFIGKGRIGDMLYRFPNAVEVVTHSESFKDPEGVTGPTRLAFFIEVGRPGTEADPAGVFNGLLMKPCTLEAH